ncbi:MAG: hypothetical protein ABEJ23_05060 [Haloarculaceae archaeon]
MTDDDLEPAVRAFLQGAERAYGEYDQGYADADATLRVLRARIDDLAAALDGRE